MNDLQGVGSTAATAALSAFRPLVAKLVAAGLLATLVSFAGHATAADSSASVSAAAAAGESSGLEYFWPAHHQTIHYKVRSHALRGALRFTRVGDIRIGSDVWQQISVTSDRVPSLNETIYQRADAKGLYTRYSTDPDGKFVRELVFPAKVGDSWPTINRDGSPTRRKIESVGECKLRDAQFEQCVKVSFHSAEGSAVAFFVPGYGELVNSQHNGFLERTLLQK